MVRDAAGRRTAGTEEGRPGPPLAARAGATETLRHRDLADLAAAEREQVRRLPAAPAPRDRVRRTARRPHRPAHRVAWADPLEARPGYAPPAAGTAAALPSVDVFVEGHRLAALENLAAVVRGASPDEAASPARAATRPARRTREGAHRA
ncbi:hypothetical protein [Streptomyces sp. NPDC058625]|uniref:hypothetical protein n=1 Tax=Streptomyces sp. NPDC058625 TaxID=3346564 RepID=UPI00364E7BA8